MEPMTRETFEKHWSTINISSRMPVGVSFHPDDGHALVEAKVITEGALPKKRREQAEDPEAWEKARSYEVNGLRVSFDPGVPKGSVIWVGQHCTVVGRTVEDGKLVNA